MDRRAPTLPSMPDPPQADAERDDEAADGFFDRLLAESPTDTVDAPADDGARLRDFFRADTADRATATAARSASAKPSPAAARSSSNGWPANNYGPAYWSAHEERKRRGLQRTPELRRGARSEAEVWDVDELAEAPEETPPAPPAESAPALPWHARAVAAHGSGPDAWLDGLDDRLTADGTAATEARMVGLLRGDPLARTHTLIEAAETLYARPQGLGGGFRLVDGAHAATHALPPRPPRAVRLRPALRRLAVVAPAAAAVGTFLGMVVAAML